MKRHAAIAGLLCSVLACAQDTEPVLRSTTRLVEVSVIATDHHGEPVTGLTAADFRIRDGGKDRDIRVFSASENKGDVLAATAPQPGNTFTNVNAPPASAVTVFVIDYLNTEWTDQVACNRALLRYLRRVRPEDHLAIYTIGANGLRVLYDFTTDASDLVAALAKSRGEINFDQGLQLADLLNGDGRQSNRQTRMSALLDADATNSSTLVTLRAFEQLATVLAGIPARKNLIWISGGVAGVKWDGAGSDGGRALMRAPVPDPHHNGVRLTDSMGGMAGYSREIDHAMQHLNGANVALYPIEARGLKARIPGTTSADEAVSTDGDEQNMLAMAAATGGRATVLSNDIEHAIETAAASHTVTYTLGFYADPHPARGGFHKLEVKLVDRPGVALRYRKGYQDDPQPPSDGMSRKHGLDSAAWSPLDANAIPLRATAESDGSLRLNIALRSIDVQPVKDRWKGLVDVLVVERDQHGTEFQRVNDTLNLDLQESTYRQLLQTGIPYRRTMALNPQATYLRVVVRDAETGNLGSLTIPIGRAGLGGTP